MDKILLAICNVLSCFIICTILFQFMNERYKKSCNNKTLYIMAEIAMGITAFCINMLNFAILNLLIWFVGVGVTVYFLYYEAADRPIRRIMECEVLVLCMSICETLGVLLLHCFLQIGGISNIDVVMQYCLEVAFSKIVLIFLYYVLINRLIKRTEAACSREQYIIYGIMLFYSLVNMLVIVQNFRDGQKSYVELSYIEPIDIITIFGNLLDNAIEATANAGGEKYIFIKISAYHKMMVVHIENSCGKVKWKKRMPVSDKGKGRGIGLLNVKQSIDKYDGDLQLKQDGNRFVADLFLNS